MPDWQLRIRRKYGIRQRRRVPATMTYDDKQNTTIVGCKNLPSLWLIKDVSLLSVENNTEGEVASNIKLLRT